MGIFNDKKEKKQQRKAMDAFLLRLPAIKKAFLQFQIDNDCRCAIVNELQAMEGYQPNILIDMLLQNNRISWRPMEGEERTRLLEVIEKKEKDMNPVAPTAPEQTEPAK